SPIRSLVCGRFKRVHRCAGYREAELSTLVTGAVIILRENNAARSYQDQIGINGRGEFSHRGDDHLTCVGVESVEIRFEAYKRRATERIIAIGVGYCLAQGLWDVDSGLGANIRSHQDRVRTSALRYAIECSGFNPIGSGSCYRIGELRVLVNAGIEVVVCREHGAIGGGKDKVRVELFECILIHVDRDGLPADRIQRVNISLASNPVWRTAIVGADRIGDRLADVNGPGVTSDTQPHSSLLSNREHLSLHYEPEYHRGPHIGIWIQGVVYGSRTIARANIKFDRAQIVQNIPMTISLRLNLKASRSS